MAAIRNIFACLVHESIDCVMDLVRNLHSLDPTSRILLYNGSSTPGLLHNGFLFERYGAVVHPSPRPMAWGYLHGFALDCMQFALNELSFDTLTIVDSDQLGTRAGYSQFLGDFIQGYKKIGLLGSSPGVRHRPTEAGPANAALTEIELWRPFLRRFPQGEEKFVHWTFWPATVFTADAARNVTQLFATDAELRALMERSRIWASEEVILPTLVALLGYQIAANPCSYDYVKYRASYTPAQIDAALGRNDVFWIHPVPRKYDDPLRKRVREGLGHYQISANRGFTMPESKSKRVPALILSLPILQRMRMVRGWLEDAEADLLIAACSRALTSLSSHSAVVEVGSFCGRSTVVLGSVVQSLGAPTKVYAVDPHDGIVGALDLGTQSMGPSLDIFRHNIAENALTPVVEAVACRSFEVTWDKPIAFLFIDGLHDYGNVSRDFHHFEPWVMAGGYIAFHDYADYYPGVKIFVDEILCLPQFEKVHCSASMMVIRKISSQPIDVATSDSRSTAGEKDKGFELSPTPVRASAEVVSSPLVSCLMPTANRRKLVPQAIRHFLRQDYPNRELIILDDGNDNISDLIPNDERIRYTRLAQRISMGAKHNMACEIARGEVIVHWDDDDWNAERRISCQIKDLLQSPQDTLCGLSRIWYYDPRSDRAWEYLYPNGGRPWVLGATFCYFKKFWERNRFPDMNEGADTIFVWNLQNANVVAHRDHTFYVGTMHAHNTSPKHTETGGWRPLSSLEIRCLLDDEDWSFYERFGSQ
jgi:hypothetical protein